MISRFTSPEATWAASAGGHLGGLVGHRVDVPVRFEWGPRTEQTEHIVDKRPEIRGQDRLVYLLRRGIFRRGGTYGSVRYAAGISTPSTRSAVPFSSRARCR